jgi:hypothetical protein
MGQPEFFGGFDPFLDDDFDVGESFLVGLSIGAAGKFGDFGDKRFVGLTPIELGTNWEQIGNKPPKNKREIGRATCT